MNLRLPGTRMMRPRRLAAALVPLACLAGCANFDGIAPGVSELAPEKLGATHEAVVWPRDDWWVQLGDPQLDALVARALAGNPRLDVARARLARAQAAVTMAAAANLPRVDAQEQTTWQRFSENFYFPPPIGGSTQATNLVQFTGSWELDFFGRNRAALRAALSGEQATAVELQASRIAVATGVARTYVHLARLLGTRGVLEDTLAQRAQVLKLVEARVASGLDTKVELRQAEGAIPEVRRQIEAADEQIALTRHALAALLGEGPDETAGLTPRLAQVAAPALPPSIPVDLVGRRADISAARWRVEAAGAEVDVAKAQFYPNINLAAFAGLQSLGFANWFALGSTVWGVGPAISLPVFDAGRLRANLGARTADVDAAVASYNATLTDAVRDVADQIASLRSIERQAAEQRAAQQAAGSAYQLATLRYRAGLGSYLTVLAAETGVLTQRLAGADLGARRMEATIELMRALGGGFDAGADSPRTQVSTTEPR